MGHYVLSAANTCYICSPSSYTRNGHPTEGRKDRLPIFTLFVDEEKKRLDVSPRCETAMLFIQMYLFVLEVDVVGFSCFDGVGVEDVRSNLLAVHVDTAAELYGGAGFHPGDHQHPLRRGRPSSRGV